MRKKQVKKYYFPSFLLNLALPVAIPIASGLIFLILFIDYISNPSKWPISSLAIVFVSVTAIFFLIWLIVYVPAKHFSSFFEVHNDKLFLKNSNTLLKELRLDSISSFLIETTASLEASGGLIKIELFVLNHGNFKQKIFQNDIGNSLIRSWKKFMIKLKRSTKKEFQFHHYVVDIEGKKHESEEYQKIQWKKRIPLFRSPYR